ncbi:5'-nucleotidase C-terminal domain-containing protein [Caldibacillus lycopersici]|uniref:5'-nucleotidase C-terminal domain-containing protein n=1 Tax=Perspicuibacillus lycopersici TaxID=1325689 RepID=A0AAE3LNF1_9BACI|nr:5'-nucleotidase C-terminal domain-containing protein [Perspicuibacillus lycopersici]MCU9614635.1 5'-nucleotidase C-terminal domain-containing protein [Perspicuibacillus lycopersici]
MKYVRNKMLLVVTIFAILFSYTIPYAQVSFATEVDAITVEEAIANNNGTATVTGYIVGYTLGVNNYDFEAPFNGDTNFALADNPDETDPTKILPVQLTSDYRAEFGLASNPEIVGEKVFVSGNLEAYFSVPGLKSPSSIWFDGDNPNPPEEENPTPPEAGLSIHDIQGDSHHSPYADEQVENVQGVVTFVQDSRNFFIQSLNPDDNPNTSEGILVYKSSHGVEVGDFVNVSGTVKEWVITSSKIDIDLPVTEINASNVQVLQSGIELPEPIVLDGPTTVIDNDSFGVFDPAEDALDYYETLEGMLVAVDHPVVVGPQSYGEIPVLTKTVANKTYTTNGGVLLTDETANPERILIDVFNYDFVTKVGDQFDGMVEGVLSFDFSNFKVYTDEDQLPELIEREYTPPVTTLAGDADSLTIATYNIENYHHALTEKTAKIAQSIITNLHAPDIIGLVEMQDNDGATNSGNADASENYEALITAIAAAGGPSYEWTDIAPEYNQDGGEPGGNIRVGFLYNPARVQLADGEKGTATEAVAFVDGSLTLNPGRIDPTNEAFADSRKPLAAQFTFNGEDIIVVANHFNSKGGDHPLNGINQPPVLSSEQQRLAIAEVVNGFVSDILAEDPDANVVVMGDLNDFQFSTPIEVLKGDILTDLVENVPLAERYSYNYEGNSQVLDHILATNSLATNAEIEMLHLNADYMEAHGRASDHDPVVAQFNLAEAPAEEEDFELTIMHTNDSHARVEQFPILANAVEQVRAESENSLLLNAGDVFTGTLYFTLYQGLADEYFMNAIGFDAMTFGNHEFDKGSDVLENFVNGAEFPFVSANVDFSADEFLADNVVDEIGNPGENGKIYPAIIKEIDGEQVGIFGLTTETTPTSSSPSEDIIFEDAVEKSNQTIAMLEAQGINKIIALSHLGYDVDLELAQQVDGIDVIVGGHTHTVLPEGVVIEKEEPTVIVQTGENLNNLGKLAVTFDENGVITEHSASLLALTEEAFGKNEELEAKVQEYRAAIDELMNLEIGETTVPLNGERADVRTKETNLGNLIADGMVWKVQQFIPETTIAFQNGGGVRASIDEGTITMGEIQTVLPFANTLVAIELSGEEIWEALEHSVSEYPEQSGGFFQVSGLKFKFDPEKPAGERVWSVEVKTADGGYEPINLEEFYSVATNSFTAMGGDGYESLKNAYEDGRMTNIDIPDFEAFSEYLEQFSPVAPAVEGRIIAAAEGSEDPDNGEQPGDGNDPGNGEDPGDGDQPVDNQQPEDNETPTNGDQTEDGAESGTNQPGNQLPNTATNNGNLLALGLLLIIGSSVTIVYFRKSKKALR